MQAVHCDKRTAAKWRSFWESHRLLLAEQRLICFSEAGIQRDEPWTAGTWQIATRGFWSQTIDIGGSPNGD